MKGSALLRRVWKWVKWPLIVVVVAYIAFTIWGVTLVFDRDKTEAAVAKIHAQKITLADVTGKNLPPIPDQAENDATVAGIDKNNNGIRDDVELAIFKKYSSDAKVRAAELQYALSIQIMLTKVFNEGTWVAAIEQVTRGHVCLSRTVIRGDNLELFLKTLKSRFQEVEDWVVNTDLRKETQKKSYDFTTDYPEFEGDACDIVSPVS